MRPDGVPWTEGVTEERAERHADGRSWTVPLEVDRPPTPEHSVASRPTSALTADQPVRVRTTFTERAVVTISGARQPIVAILLMIALFTVLAGKPLDGLLLAIVAIAMAWDAGMAARQPAVSAGTGNPEGVQGSAGSAWPDESAWRPRAGRPRRRHTAIGVTGAVIYSLTVGSFSRMSWPATAGVVGLGAGVVIMGWGGPTRQRDIPRRFSKTGVLSWGSLVLAACLWELGALLGQPTLALSSYAHPTISTLTDPLLATSLGRTAALIGWIALGAFLVER
jgi:hypothetical protein